MATNFAAAARQGAAAFGDAGVFVEKYVQVRMGGRLLEWRDHQAGMA